MEADSIKHLEFLQGVINRHNSNSFMIKGWAITLAAALYALTGTIKDPYLSFIAIGPIVMFWVLDSIYLANERCFVSLYSCVTKNNKLIKQSKEIKKKCRNKEVKNGKSIYLDTDVEITTSLFSMNFLEFRKIKRNNWYRVLFSYTIIWFYSLLFIITIIVFIGMGKLNEKPINDTIKVNTYLKSDTLMIRTINAQDNQCFKINNTVNHGK